MKRMALVKDGVVHSVVMVSPQYEVPKGFKVIETDHANIGDTHDGKVFNAPPAPQLDKAKLLDYARRRREVMTRSFLEFNLAKPGDDLMVVRIPLTNEYREDIRELAHSAELTGEDCTLVLPDKTITLSPAQAIQLRTRLATLISHSHELLAKLVAGIASGHIASQEHVDFPEKATAVKLPSWFPPHG